MSDGNKATTNSKADGAINMATKALKTVTLRNLLLATATSVSGYIIDKEAFTCPEHSHRLYGYTFLCAPIVILFFVNVLVIGEVWKIASKRHVERYNRRVVYGQVVLSLFKACVAPVVWLIVAFLEEDYYLCAKLGPSPLSGNATSGEEIAEWNRLVEENKSISKVLAWGLLVALVAVTTVLVIWKRCYVSDNLLMPNTFQYERREALAAMKRFTELMNPNAKFIYKDADLDGDPETFEYGGDEKVKYYKSGVPEKIGKLTVEKLCEGLEKDWSEKKNWTETEDKWHYLKAYQDFQEMYPRICTGSPCDPWRAVEGKRKPVAVRWEPYFPGKLRPQQEREV